MTVYMKYIKSNIYKALCKFDCSDIAKMKISRKVLKDYEKINPIQLVAPKVFVQELNEEEEKGFFIQLDDLNWQFTRDGSCTHSGTLKISKKLLDELKKLKKENE